MNNEDMISVADIKKIIADEINDIQATETDGDENLITVDVKKLHYKTECRLIMSRIMEFIAKREEQNHD